MLPIEAFSLLDMYLKYIYNNVSYRPKLYLINYGIYIENHYIVERWQFISQLL